MENTAALIVAILCGGAGLMLLLFIKDESERKNLIRLFTIAYVIRLGFTTLCYSIGLISVLGGADDIAWQGGWQVSRDWQLSGPSSFWDSVYGDQAKRNSGYRYFIALFYYILGVRSQMALAFVNCFVNSLVVLAIYKVAREFFSEKASSFAAWVAVILPGFLIWSALTIKETWLILFEILTFYLVWKLAQKPRLHYVLPAIALIILTLGFRFYAAWILTAGSIMVLVYASNMKRPLRATFISVGLIFLFVAGLDLSKIAPFDLTSIVSSRLQEAETLRDGIARVRVGGNTTTSVVLDYDLSTPTGSIMMILVGTVYLLLSPFPWQLLSVRQAMALPDVILWWWIVFGFILPGISYAWRYRPAMLLSIVSMIGPLILFYSLIFGNIGLAYRQRAQMMPFFLVLAAAGYESKRQRNKISVWDNKEWREKNRSRLAYNIAAALLREQTNNKPR